MLFDDSTLGPFVENIKEYKKIRMMGSASLMLAYVAMGKSSAYSERGIMLWDVAAGIALCKEAGLNVKTEIVEGLKLNVSVTS
jgi:myo-inositol-1(or 4)-monophosphatase